MITLLENTINKIDNFIKEQLPESKYQFELYDFKTNTKHFRGVDEPFHWGSVYKLFVVAEIIKMSEEGLLKLDDELVLHKELYQNGSGILKYFTHLDRLSYLDACKMVMATSDNLCADELLNIVSIKRINLLFKLSESKNTLFTYNLNDLVERLFKLIEFKNEAKFYRSENFILQFNQALKIILKDQYTSVSDLNKTLHFIIFNYLKEESVKTFFQTIQVHTTYPRPESYTVFSPIKIIGKSGSLGYHTVFNQTSIIFNTKTQKPLAIVSIMLKNNKHRGYETTDKYGLIGLEIATLYEQLEDLKK